MIVAFIASNAETTSSQIAKLTKLSPLERPSRRNIMPLLIIKMMCAKCAEETRLKHEDVNISSAFALGEKQRCESCRKMHDELYETTVFR